MSTKFNNMVFSTRRRICSLVAFAMSQTTHKFVAALFSTAHTAQYNLRFSEPETYFYFLCFVVTLRLRLVAFVSLLIVPIMVPPPDFTSGSL
ncbi:hypothetical protein VNO80_05543 [Phaseolus coccineus]|uniref:Uncharacterized protein n=1 Tax=Phaseolus coccineus TaxID=3886 RepID=A0AAN9NK21_PHACN